MYLYKKLFTKYIHSYITYQINIVLIVFYNNYYSHIFMHDLSQRSVYVS